MVTVRVLGSAAAAKSHFRWPQQVLSEKSCSISACAGCAYWPLPTANLSLTLPDPPGSVSRHLSSIRPEPPNPRKPDLPRRDRPPTYNQSWKGQGPRPVMQKYGEA